MTTIFGGPGSAATAAGAAWPSMSARQHRTSAIGFDFTLYPSGRTTESTVSGRHQVFLRSLGPARGRWSRKVLDGTYQSVYPYLRIDRPSAISMNRLANG